MDRGRISRIMHGEGAVRDAALSLFFYNLYTSIDSIIGNVAPSLASPGAIAPYDAYSLGIAVVLVAAIVSPRLRAALFGSPALASGATLMAVGPLYTTLGLPGHSSFALALLGGCGKGIVTLQVGLALGMIGARELVRVVPAAMGLSLVLGSVAAAQPVLFSAVSLIVAPLAALLAARSAAQGVVELSASGAVGPSQREVVFLAAAVSCMAAACILCSNPLQEALATDAPRRYELLLIARMAAAAAAGFILAATVRCSGSLVMAHRLVVLLSALGVTAFLAFAPAQTAAPYGLALTGRFLFQMLFWTVAPLSFLWLGAAGVSEGSSLATRDIRAGAGTRSFALLACCYCGSLSIVFLGLRVAPSGEMGAWTLATGVALLLVGALLLAPERLLAEATRPTAVDGRAAWDAAVAQLAARYRLSGRETEVMALAARGRDSRVIQETLGVSSSTVSTHMQNMYRKLDIHSRQELIDLIEGVLAADERP